MSVPPPAAPPCSPTPPAGSAPATRSSPWATSSPRTSWRTLHHLDLIAHLPGARQPPAEGLARSREMLEQIAGSPFPATFHDVDALLIGTGRRAPTGAEQAGLGAPASRVPLYLG